MRPQARGVRALSAAARFASVVSSIRSVRISPHLADPFSRSPPLKKMSSPKASGLSPA
jgi:hypothetical protein